MSCFPLCIEMKNAVVFLCGSGRLAEEKLEKLLSFEADVIHFSEHDIAGSCHPQVKRFKRKLQESDLITRPAFVIAAEEKWEENRRISNLCRERNIPINAVDVPSLCSFYFPALIRRGEVTLSISTGGKSPMAASVLRKRLEDAVPDRLEDILDWSAELRQKLSETIPDQKQRREVLRRAISQAMEENRILSEEEIESLL